MAAPVAFDGAWKQFPLWAEAGIFDFDSIFVSQIDLFKFESSNLLAANPVC